MVYLDNNATTPVDPAVAEKMSNFLKEHFGNPSTLYPIGRQVKEMITEAREIVAKALGAGRTEIVFTGSGTEADNFAIRGVLDAFPEKNEVIISAIEHPAIIETAHYLEKKGVKITYIPVDKYGTIYLDFLKDAITPQTALISIMQANNEIGTIQPIEEVCKVAKARGILVHTDAVQSFGKIDVSVNKLGVDLLSISAHKIYG
ncbi:MAG: aminotransferase class V-fold PLP-dependent enzyme, partial [Candidatus Aminicenantes bacterium]|nr:aminotransferase class V-fold PLP-dependent enzyme [Candidatus Aminicenantes bacterium]